MILEHDNNKTKKIYETIRDAAKSINMMEKTLGAKLRGINPNETNLAFYNNNLIIKKRNNG